MNRVTAIVRIRSLITKRSYSVLSGHTMKDVQNKIEAHFWITMKTAWSVWIPAQLFNFYFMPLHYRYVTYQNEIIISCVVVYIIYFQSGVRTVCCPWLELLYELDPSCKSS